MAFFLSGVSAAGDVPRSDRSEVGLIGNVKMVVTTENLIKETEVYDPSGRLLQRTQEPAHGRGGIGRITFMSQYDAAGNKRVDVVRDEGGALIKQTVYLYNGRGMHRTAEVTAWADGAFANASFYEYDARGNRIRGVHFNAPALINRNLYHYDEQKRVIKEMYSRNYMYDSKSGEAVHLPGLTFGYEVRIRYNAQGYIAEKIIYDLRGVRESRSEFEYDEHGQQVEERLYDSRDRLTGQKHYDYLYDAHGNWISETLRWWEIDHGKSNLKQSHTRQRSITYF